jgi:hypothetical protein
MVHKHGRLEFLPNRDLPHTSYLSLEVLNSNHAYFFASIGGFSWFFKNKIMQQVLDRNLSPSSHMSLIWSGYHKQLKDWNDKPERGEWMGADKKSIQEFGLWTRFHSYASTSFSCQVHVASGVLLDLGARHNQQPLETHSGKQHYPATGRQTGQTDSLGLSLSTGRGNQSGRFSKPVKPVLSRNSPKHLRD